ncbi:putative motility protein chaperone MotE [Campylobacter pinnipediorum subsp. caledonicus]|uniref:MotE family protein n=1 Tax=Campylobacter pinnipediorum TaxID=1965231 RepID=UPI000994D9A6|nr:MotE family protein [Campylobacter pinnipediorum]AQW86777.1 putative motility protein chaperone MotE [Campylobacter pinnipediorum subsp. caledonicus]
MKNIFYIFIFLCSFVYADDASVDCNQIFEARKGEILKEFDRIDEQRQALEAFRASVKSLYDEKISNLNKKELDINSTLKTIENKKKEIDTLIEKNNKILQELKNMTTDKVSASYAKMKDQAAADILSDMSVAQAASIMYALEPKKISAIMAKMQPNVASDITIMLTKGPPFKDIKKQDEKQAPEGNILDF